MTRKSIASIAPPLPKLFATGFFPIKFRARTFNFYEQALV